MPRERPLQDRTIELGRQEHTSTHSEMARLQKRTSPDGSHSTVEDVPTAQSTVLVGDWRKGNKEEVRASMLGFQKLCD